MLASGLYEAIDKPALQIAPSRNGASLHNIGNAVHRQSGRDGVSAKAPWSACKVMIMPTIEGPSRDAEASHYMQFAADRASTAG
jgi:hypothetical protein